MPTPLASAPRILCEVPPRTPDLCAAMWAGQGDPLYAIGSSWRQRRQLASDCDLPWSTGEGEGFYIALSREEISSLRRAAAMILDAVPYGKSEEMDSILDDAGFFTGDPVRDEGQGWPDDYASIVSGEGPDGEIIPGLAVLAHPKHGLVLCGKSARRELAEPSLVGEPENTRRWLNQYRV